MDEAATRDALLAAVEDGAGRHSSLIVLDAAPLHSLWIARHLHLLLELDLTVAIPEAVRGIFAAHQDCRKGREVIAFLDRNTPPLEIRQIALHEFYGHFGPPTDAAEPVPVFALVEAPPVWRCAKALQHVQFVDVRDLAWVAEEAGLLESVHEIAHAIELPGEVHAWR
ncbi:hypothetical protein [Limimaricola hongkongensis]|uniref:hypothetical protein n=1 Tax=Limimaricola hongkongensis TaxID=278132 RepID=UPI0003793913|nr:hypothetical protein [Limimaricola hongkongensis]